MPRSPLIEPRDAQWTTCAAFRPQRRSAVAGSKPRWLTVGDLAGHEVNDMSQLSYWKRVMPV
jgi:hypothetical protein